MVSLAFGNSELDRYRHRYDDAGRNHEFKRTGVLNILQLVKIPGLLPEQERSQILLGEGLDSLIHIDLDEQLHQVLVLLVDPRNELIELFVNYLQTRRICFYGLLL